jgi:hypothetical protein
MSIVTDAPLAEYTTVEEHLQHALYAKQVAHYHVLKAQAVKHRLEGRIPQAQTVEARCEKLAQEIEQS